MDRLAGLAGNGNSAKAGGPRPLDRLDGTAAATPVPGVAELALCSSTGGAGRPNLALRVLDLSLRRLADEMLATHGFPILLADSLVDVQRLAGTC